MIVRNNRPNTITENEQRISIRWSFRRNSYKISIVTSIISPSNALKIVIVYVHNSHCVRIRIEGQMAVIIVFSGDKIMVSDLRHSKTPIGLK